MNQSRSPTKRKKCQDCPSKLITINHIISHYLNVTTWANHNHCSNKIVGFLFLFFFCKVVCFGTGKIFLFHTCGKRLEVLWAKLKMYRLLT